MLFLLGPAAGGRRVWFISSNKAIELFNSTNNLFVPWYITMLKTCAGLESEFKQINTIMFNMLNLYPEGAIGHK